ncbi:hypothetical protein CHS0354_019593 [Potamilus streckersoni]|uniref:TIR domain-containing protein n=1 Tax=Potamilus streckersoni TaxID=2493646 RepID=A0AAE0TFU5_9BIVA|nr:hypothetical protein CHS0354_019593 [Potamilus streckersoni]
MIPYQLKMRTDSDVCFVVTFVSLIVMITAKPCAPVCQCRTSGNYSSVCMFDKHVDVNVTADAFFDFPVEYIRSLRLEFNNNEDHDSLEFPFKEFFQLNFVSLIELYILSNRTTPSRNLSQFRMEALEPLPRLSRFSFHVKNANISPVNMSLKLKLRYLDVSTSRDLNFDLLCKIVILSGSDLEEVYAEGINDGHYWTYKGTLDDEFFSCFENTRLRVLYIPESNIKVLASPKLNIYVPFLEILDVSRNDVFIDINTFTAVLQLKQLKKLIASNVPFPKSKMEQTCDDDKSMRPRENHVLCENFQNEKILRSFQSLEVFDIGGSTDCHNINTFYCARRSQCLFPNNTLLRELYIDHLCIMRMDMLVRGLNRLEILDFSSNLCEYISSQALSELTALKTLRLNGNYLSKMEKSNPEELSILFLGNPNLVVLDLSANGFTRLPEDIFLSNTKLEILNLSNNFLHNTDWLSDKLVNLQSVNLNANSLTTIDTRTRQVVDDSANGYNKSIGHPGGIHLKLANNPISCSCDQEDVLRWLSAKGRHISDMNEIFCSETGGLISIYTDDIDSYSNSCKFRRYRGLLALCTIPIIVAICVVVYLRHYRRILRIRRIRKQLNEFVYDNFHVQRRFLVYLAYSFSDSDIVLNKIFPYLEGRLMKEVGEQENLVCISDRDFDVGVSISDEIIQAVTSSCVVLFIVSKEFARSRWCEFEAEIALYQGKPIILVILGDVKVRSLPASLRKVCFKWTRLEWPGIEKQDKLEEFWNKLVKAIVKYTDESENTPDLDW